MRVRVRDLDRPKTGFPALQDPAPSAAEAQAVAGLMSMIEGNVLFSGHLAMPEEQDRCYSAVGELRRFISQTSLLLPEDALAQSVLGAMRAACRKYMDEVEAWDRRAGRRHAMPSFGFYQLLGAFREVMGLNLWRLADAYDLDIEARLAGYFPGVRD
ncbi:MAG: hypothetical protein ACM33T_00660 [Solirubrobacterales bacterium]